MRIQKNLNRQKNLTDHSEEKIEKEKLREIEKVASEALKNYDRNRSYKKNKTIKIEASQMRNKSYHFYEQKKRLGSNTTDYFKKTDSNKLPTYQDHFTRSKAYLSRRSRIE